MQLNDKVKDKLDPILLETISNPKLKLVLEDAKLEIVDSIFFHSNDLN